MVWLSPVQLYFVFGTSHFDISYASFNESGKYQKTGFLTAFLPEIERENRDVR